MSSTKPSPKGNRKDPKNANPSNSAPDDEEVLQAVVLADSFDERFKPLTLDKPRCLLPLCNIPLIEYTFEMLVLSSVQEVFVLACAFSDQVRSYIKASKWGKPGSSLKIHVIVAQQLLSVGDALREIDSKSIIRSDFVLLFGDTVSNVKLQDAVAAHKARRKLNKDALMTMVVQEASLTHPSRQPEINPVYVLDSNTKECIYYEPYEAFPEASELSIPSEALAKVSKRAELEVRKDLLDCFVDICSVEVPALFTENFDYQDLRSDFVHGVLTSDLLGKSIHCHVMNNFYSARVSGPKMYAAVSRDVLGRWAYPLVPDANLLGDTTYTYSRRQVYKEAGVAPAQSCVLERRLAIGSGTTLGANTILRDSVIGRNCHIGGNVLLDKAFIFDGVKIGDNSKIHNAIIGYGSQILDDVTINSGSIIANGCIVGPNNKIPPYTKMSASLPSPPLSDEDSEGESEQAVPTKANHFGPNAFEWFDSFSDHSDDEDFTQQNYLLTQLARVPEPSNHKYDELTEDDDGHSSDGSEAELDKEEARAVEFEREAKMTVERALKEGLTVDNALLELTALRMSYNAQFIQVREVVIPQLLLNLDFTKPLASTLKLTLFKWAPLISKFTLSEYDMIDAIDILLSSCADLDSQFSSKLFTLGLSQLYDLDILAEDAIRSWYENNEPDRLSDRLNEYNKLRDAAKPFIDWLDEAEEEDSD